MQINSPVRYQGSKRKLIDTILEHAPDVPRAIDVFGGSAVVTANLPHAKRLYNELSPHVFDIVDWLSTEPIKNYRAIERMVKKYDLSRENETQFLNFRTRINKVPTPLGHYVAHRFAHSNLLRFNLSGMFNAPFGKREIDFKQLRIELTQFAASMHSVKKTNLDYVQLFKQQHRILDSNTFVYLDPPYYASGAMQYGTWGEWQERQLLHCLDVLDSYGCRFMLSNVFSHRGFENPYLMQWAEARKHRTIHLDVDYQMARAYDQTDNKTDEVLIMNY